MSKFFQLIKECDLNIKYHTGELDKLKIQILNPEYDSKTIREIVMPIHNKRIVEWEANKKHLEELK